MKKPVKKLTGLARQAQEAMRLAVRGVIAEHRKTGEPLVIWRNGRVARVKVGALASMRAKRSRGR
jgi:hypothetical protein